MRIYRLLAITVLMLNRDLVTARELSDKFEVTVRTIYRDMDALLLAGIPVMSYPGNEGGYGLSEHYKINRQLLSHEEILSVLSSLQSVTVSLENNQYESAFEKIKSLLPEDKKSDLNRQTEQIIIDFHPWGGNLRQKTNLSAIHKAIVSGLIIEFTYTDTNGNKIRRRVEPMTLFFRGYGWYLFAYCLYKQDFRVFRVTRIRDLMPTGAFFKRRSKSYRDLEPLVFAGKDKTELLIRFSNNVGVWVEDMFDDNDIIERKGTSITVKTTAESEEWIYPWILSFGEYAEILKPERIRKKISEIAKKIYKKYQT